MKTRPLFVLFASLLALGEPAMPATHAQSSLCACAADAPLTHHWIQPARPPRRSAADTPVVVSEFDVLIVYTPAALSAEGSVEALNAQAAAAMADANACYANSLIPIHGNIVGVRPVNYTESGEIRTDLHRLAVPDDGILDEVQGYRDEAQADLVCMFTSRASADGYKGYAEILTALTADGEILGFSVVDVKAATIEHLFAHELGHNMGCDHDRENTTGLHLFDFSYGWRFTGRDGRLYRDVMAYAPGTSVPYFANPAVLFEGTPTGVADFADTARTLIESAPAFVNFRAADGRGRVSVSASVAESTIGPSGGQKAEFAFERTGSVAQPLDVGYEVGGTAIAGVNIKALRGTLTFPAGSHFATLPVKPIKKGPPFGVETVVLTLQAQDRYVVADSPSGGATEASVTIYDRLPLVGLGKVRRTGTAPGKLKFRVTRLGRTDEPLVVHFQLGGTAIAGIDYRLPDDESVTIPAGATSAAATVHLFGGAAPASGGQPAIQIELSPDESYNLGPASEVDLTL